MARPAAVGLVGVGLVLAGCLAPPSLTPTVATDAPTSNRPAAGVCICQCGPGATEATRAPWGVAPPAPVVTAPCPAPPPAPEGHPK